MWTLLLLRCDVFWEGMSGVIQTVCGGCCLTDYMFGRTVFGFILALWIHMSLARAMKI